MRTWRLVLGCIWAGALLLIGLWLWDMPIKDTGPGTADLARLVRCGAVWAIAASQFVFMVFVADALFPRAPRSLTSFLKLVTGMLVWLTLGYGVWVSWSYLN